MGFASVKVATQSRGEKYIIIPFILSVAFGVWRGRPDPHGPGSGRPGYCASRNRALRAEESPSSPLALRQSSRTHSSRASAARDSVPTTSALSS